MNIKKSQTTKTPTESTFVTRKIAGPDQVNPNGTLFGGVIMAWIDEVAFMSARRYAGVPFVVTASIDNITFISPLQAGDHITLTSCVNYVGRTSMEIGVKVEHEDPYSGVRKQVTSAYLTFVALDRKGRPTEVPRLKLESEDDFRRFEEAKLRVKVRERIRRRMKQKIELNQKESHAREAAKLIDFVHRIRRDIVGRVASLAEGNRSVTISDASHRRSKNSSK